MFFSSFVPRKPEKLFALCVGSFFFLFSLLSSYFEEKEKGHLVRRNFPKRFFFFFLSFNARARKERKKEDNAREVAREFLFVERVFLVCVCVCVCVKRTREREREIPPKRRALHVWVSANIRVGFSRDSESIFRLLEGPFFLSSRASQNRRFFFFCVSRHFLALCLLLLLSATEERKVLCSLKTRENVALKTLSLSQKKRWR